ncbi:site-specific integrase [Algoriphagus halophilus]|uniref:tyrosine-type recombinase/integrase n=1 Tax=Algoriphagus halophilus TaxID=226505 RepID=UPI00358F2834
MARRIDKAKDPVSISYYLDTRRKKQNGMYPVKIRVYDGITKKVRLYSTDFDLDEKTFDRIKFPEKGRRLREEEKSIKSDLDELLIFYKEKLKLLQIFTFDSFEESLIVKTGEKANTFFQYETYVKELKEYERIATASSYDLSMRSLKSFLKSRSGKVPSKLLFQEITVKFLNDYESWMVNIQGKSQTTVGIYMRGLRVIFNRAIDQKIIDRDIYPFGRKKYEIPSSTRKKKALNGDQLKLLFNSIPKTKEQQKARDFWFFSFACNGINMKDIIHLKWKNINGEFIEFIREKTKKTKKANSKTIQVPLTEFAKSVIKKYSTDSKNPENYIFPFLKKEMSAEEKYLVNKKFIRFVNQHLKIMANANGITGEISSYWARHSFATSAIRNDASMEFVGESLGHSDVKTTQLYFAGFEDDTKKDILGKITDFMH